MIKSLIKDVAWVTAGDYASASADRKLPLTGVDTKNFTGIFFLIKWATIAAGAVTSVKLQHSDTTTDGDFVDVATSAQAVADSDDNKITLIEALALTKRYYRILIDKDAANATAESVVAGLTGAHKLPVTQASEVLFGGELIINPTTGTA